MLANFSAVNRLRDCPVRRLNHHRGCEGRQGSFDSPKETLAYPAGVRSRDRILRRVRKNARRIRTLTLILALTGRGDRRPASCAKVSKGRAGILRFALE